MSRLVAITLYLSEQVVQRLKARMPAEEWSAFVNGLLEDNLAEKRMGRPPGRTREKRSINLEPRLWAWLEAQRLPNETFNDTCNRIIDAASQVLPAPTS